MNQLNCCTGTQNVYANMAGNVLVHITAPALGLSSAQWSVVSWGQSQLARESVYDHKYIYRWGSEPAGHALSWPPGSRAGHGRQFPILIERLCGTMTAASLHLKIDYQMVCPKAS